MKPKLRPCNSCPFRKDTKNFGRSDWLIDVMQALRAGGLTHSCHKTDPNADGYVGHKVGKESICMGAVAMLKAETNNVQDRKFLMLLIQNKADWECVDSGEVFHDSKEFVRHHLKGILTDVEATP